MTKRIGKLVLMSATALLLTMGIALAHDPKKKSGMSGEMMEGCGEHHAAAMKASDDLTMHLAEAKRSTTLAEMRVHVEAADKALAQMKNEMHQCMEMMGEHPAAAGKVIDPVCGMEVGSTASAPSATYKGKTYYFCSEDDKAKFEKNPEEYLKKS